MRQITAKTMPRVARLVYTPNSAGWISTALVASGMPPAKLSRVGRWGGGEVGSWGVKSISTFYQHHLLIRGLRMA